MFAAKGQKEAKDFSLPQSKKGLKSWSFGSGAPVLEVYRCCLCFRVQIGRGLAQKKRGVFSSLWGPETLQSDEGAESRVRQYGVMVRGCLVVRLSRQSLSAFTCQVGDP